MEEQGYHVVSAQELQAFQNPERDFALDVLVGLSERPRRLPSKYFYDDVGSELFRRIMQSEEYYPTDCEKQILEDHGRSIVATVGEGPINLIDLGAGDGAKTKVLLGYLMEMGVEFRYVPIDISEGAMKTLVARMTDEFPQMKIEGLVCDYIDGLNWLAAKGTTARNVLLFLGSNIGNFDRPRARAFLRRLWTALNSGDYALVGFDLKKDIDILLRAYNDSEGITAKFNLNILSRINRELEGDFDLSAFRHYGTYDVFSGAMKSYLVSLSEQRVTIGAAGRTFQFQPWEPIHTEYSYKYLESDIVSLATDCGFNIEAQYRDRDKYFVDSLWCVDKRTRMRTRPMAPQG